MNKAFRLALLHDWHRKTVPRVIDFTRYDLAVREPGDAYPDKPIKDWSLINRINQKGLRVEDSPVELRELKDEEKELIYRYCPELKG
ncbi:DUF3864 domain-containing protein [Puia sp. P3]|uniref:DUF3864 domain-containing protein n=1 Tax=Puia sp. P3 TaxID=3423952 RepID=UPI003D678973